MEGKRGSKSAKLKNSSPQKTATSSDSDLNEDELEMTEKSKSETEEQTAGNKFSSKNNSREEKSTVKATFTVADLTPDDEIYTLQFPENYDKQSLCNANIDFNNLNTSVTSKGEAFKVELKNSDKKFITLAVPKSSLGASLVKLPLKGHIVIQKSVNIPDGVMTVEDALDKDTVVFPGDIKVRHPLLGTDWVSHVQSAFAVFSRHSPGKKNKSRKREKIKYEGRGVGYKVETKKIKQEL